MHDFYSIISPVAEQDFNNNYFEKKSLLIQRNDPGYFSSLLTIDAMANYLERKDTVYPRIRMVKDGIQLPNDLYVKNTSIKHHVTEIIDNEKLFSLFEDGASIVCQQLNITFPILYEFTQQLSNYFKSTIGLNTYLTPASAQAFDPHYDNHDVFILQVYGSKIWRLYDMPLPFPVNNFDKKTGFIPEPSLEVQLMQGDTLYIPRGLIHDATTANNTSLHITVGLNVETWVDVFKSITDQAASVEGFRKTFNWHQVTATELKNTIYELSIELLEKIDYNKLLADIKQKHNGRQYEVHRGRFNDLLNNKDLDDNSVVYLRKQVNTNLTADTHSINLTIRNKDVKFRLSEKELISEMLQTDEFSVAELQNKYPHLKVLKNIKTLVKHGVLGIKKA
ncbi:cupin domain-containing protein [Mucilaginibacter sp. UYCu711]|uniref:cupin domain-containing protein n=1 Tax=Mucilaginibacter sp. UYCu711 TaxID=3156339 RepID=UPI003D1DF75F